MWVLIVAGVFAVLLLVLATLFAIADAIANACRTIRHARELDRIWDDEPQTYMELVLLREAGLLDDEGRRVRR